MAVELTGRNVPVTSGLKELAKERAQKLERHLGGPAQVRVILSQEKHRFGAEVIATHRRRVWKAQEETVDPRAALALAFEKIDAQAKRDSENAATANTAGPRKSRPSDGGNRRWQRARPAAVRNRVSCGPRSGRQSSL